ncbi:MAG TPA: ABC transporter permease [Candidatus Angelobacter sp.]|nr:ABC transporter permease [Candidatus Angelobacter sp.]
MNWLQQLVSRRREYRNLSDEMAEHLQEKVDELMSSGMSRQEAETAARRQFGNALLLEEHSREVWQWATVDAVLRDLKYAFRQLRLNPGFTFTVLLTLSVAIGANTAVFSIVNALLLRPLPYAEPDRLASLMRNYRIPGSLDTEDGQDGESWELARDNVPAVQAAVYSYEASGVNLQTETAVRYVLQQRVSAGYFEVLGIHPIVGRTFTAEEDRPHGPKVVILSFHAWKWLFSSDWSVVGTSILLKGEPHVVVGVLPANTRTTAPADLWTPLQPATSGEGEGENYHIVMRLKNGSSWAEANSQLAVLRPRAFGRFAKEYPSGRAWLSARLLQQDIASAARTPVTILMSAVAVILLIACANLAGLMLVRVMRRSGELATRLALGASKASIFRQLMMEPAILAFSGGLLGLGLAVLSLGLFARFTPADMMPLGGLAIDGRVLVFALLATVATGLLIGVLPAMEIRRADIRPAMAAAASRTGTGAGQSRVRQALIAVEVTLTVVLLACAGLLVRTLVHLQTLPPGFDAENVMAAQASLDDVRYHNTDSFQRLLQQSIDAMKEIPGVESAAVGLNLPFERGLNNGFYLADGPEDKEGHMTSSAYVTPDYFHVLRIPLLSGRTFSDSDNSKSQRVAIVNESFARKFIGKIDVVGRHIRSGDESRVIVGVVGDVTKRPGLVSAPLSSEVTYYIPATQVNDRLAALVHMWFQPSWIVRTQGRIMGLTDSMQKAMAKVDPALPIAGFHRLIDLQALALRQQRFEVALLGILAGLALLLSVVGIYGLVSNMVAQRTREIGIRMALGSSVRQAMVEVGTSGITAVAIGIVGGLALSIASVHLIRSQLYGVKVYDPVTFCGVVALLILAATAATFLPTLRIARIDPASTLRAE